MIYECIQNSIKIFTINWELHIRLGSEHPSSIPFIPTRILFGTEGHVLDSNAYSSGEPERESANLDF